MPFPASNGSQTPLTLEAAWAKARDTASSIKQQATNLNAQIINNATTNSLVILNSQSFFVTLNAALTICAAVPGISTYAQNQVNDGTLNVASAFSTMQTALAAVITWIGTNFPKDGSGRLLYASFDGTGKIVYVDFSQSSLSALALLLQSLSATIS